MAGKGKFGLELVYLGDLKLRAQGRCVGTDLALLYASEDFLAYDRWPVLAKKEAENCAPVLAILCDTPLDAPISLPRWLPGTEVRDLAVRLAIFVDAGAPRSETLLVMPNGRLIIWELDDQNGLMIRVETARALAMAELIARAAAIAKAPDSSQTVR